MEERQSKLMPVAMAGVLLLPIGYVLSAGPIAWHYRSRDGAPDWVETIYRPITWLMDRSDVAEDVFDWYFELGVNRDP
jgi:hypothetical protein